MDTIEKFDVWACSLGDVGANNLKFLFCFCIEARTFFSILKVDVEAIPFHTKFSAAFFEWLGLKILYPLEVLFGYMNKGDYPY